MNEKEILMMVVERDQRDVILNALYKEMGRWGRMPRGLPVSDVAGLVKEPKPARETEE